MAPHVSIVIATYNRADILPRCLDAVAEQTYKDFEVLIVDDGSQDGTVAFVEALAREKPHLGIRLLVNETNRGANASRNRGIREAEGELVAFLDSDCIADRDWLENLLTGFVSEEVAAVTGTVNNPDPSNIYELVYKGTSRVHGAGEAHRLVAGNLVIRREHLLRFPLEEDLKWGCDEEGIFLRLRAAGYRQRFEHSAAVLHDHPFERRSFFRHARLQGEAAAWLVYKYFQPHRRDVIPFVLAYASLVLVLVDWRLAVVPLALFGVASSALLYAEIWLKGKSLWEALGGFPVFFWYYQIKVWGYVTRTLRLHLGGDEIERIRL